jgi:Rps23 Pro-64 3,4-dihydroxylase Tpa1-like proline 4-hydroxylase
MESMLKNELFENGFVTFKLKDFDEKIYNKLKVIFPKGNLKPEMFKNLKHSVIKADECEYPNNITNKSFTELDEIKKNILNKFNKEGDCDQIWFYDWPYENNTKDHPFDCITKPIFKYFYDKESKGANSQVTMYNDGCYLNNHQDGQDGYSGDRHCVILVYLSTEYEKGKGGEMILSKDKKNELCIEPIYGNVALFDFTKHNIWHKVNPVVGYNRYCFINFC